MTFWLIAGAMTALALLVVVVPLVRNKQGREIDRRRQNIAVYRDRMRELESETEGGILASEEQESAREDLLQRLPRDLQENAENKTAPRKQLRWPIAILAIIIPLLGVGLYFLGGGRHRLQMSQELPKVEAASASLKKSLQADPDNAHGWMLLGRVSMTLNRYQQAADAFAQAVAHSPQPSAILLTSQAQSLAMARGGDYRGKPGKLLRRALKLDPDNVRTLWMSGVAAEQMQQPAKALSYWKKINVDQIPASMRPALIQHLTRSREAVRIRANGFKIPLKVSLGPGVRKKLNGNDSVFIYARKVGSSGRPLVAVKRKVRDLPLHIALTDDMRMGPGPALSSLKRWVLVARVSVHGTPREQAGDWFVQRTVEKGKLDKAVSLVIHKEVR